MLRLCSLSETRAKLLDKFSIDYIQSPIDFNEDSVIASSARSFVYKVVQGKLSSALSSFNLDTSILVADTVIATSSGKILRKAKDIDDAREILLAQSSNSISIVTATILKSKRLEFIDISSTKYQFLEFESRDLDRYLNSNEWQGKAGACMVEGFCKKYIKEVIGLESNAMGLPVEKIIPWIKIDGKNR